MQEDIEQRSIAISVQAARLSARVMRAAAGAALAQMKKRHSRPRTGRNSLARLNGDGGADSIEVKGRIRSFERYAREYRVRYHIRRETGTYPPKWTVFFKADQKDALMSALKKYTQKTVNRDLRGKKPSVIAQLAKLREQIKAASKERVKNKQHGGHEL